MLGVAAHTPAWHICDCHDFGHAMQDAQFDRLQQRFAAALDKEDRRAKADKEAYERLKRAYAASKGRPFLSDEGQVTLKVEGASGTRACCAAHSKCCALSRSTIEMMCASQSH